MNGSASAYDVEPHPRLPIAARTVIGMSASRAPRLAVTVRSDRFAAEE